MNQRLLLKLGTAWEATPNTNLGKMIESIENLSWDIYFTQHPTTHFSTRLMRLPDDLLELGLDLYLKTKGVAPSGGWKS